MFVIFFPMVLTLTYHRSLIKLIIWNVAGWQPFRGIELESSHVSWNKEEEHPRYGNLPCVVYRCAMMTR